MKVIWSAVLIFICISGFGQQANSPLPSGYETMPKFELLKADSSYFNNRHIPENMPVVIIYFSPECGHCKTEAQEIFNNIDRLKHVFFVWVSYHNPESIEAFRNQFGLDRFNNMVFGRDVQYRLPVTFKVRSTPYTIIYNQNHEFVKEYRDGVAIEDLIQTVYDL